MAKTLEEYKEDAAKQTEPLRQRDIASINKSADAAIKQATDVYNKSVDTTKTKYESDYERNAVQKLINEKVIAEKNANLGLTDSGLNRAQQTAVQLSYANQKGDLDIARQNALDELNINLANSITDINTQRETSKLSINQFYDQQNDSIATSLYNTDVENEYNQWKATLDANTELEKTRLDALAKTDNTDMKQKIYWFRGVSDSGKYLYYNSETGKNEEVPAYMNPYTSNDNRIAYSAEYNNPNIGFFELADGTVGYQPRGLESEGGKFSRLEVGGKPVQFDLYGNGKYNSIWYSPSGHYWIWDDLSNSYKNMDSQVIEYLRQVL